MMTPKDFTSRVAAGVLAIALIGACNDSAADTGAHISRLPLTDTLAVYGTSTHLITVSTQDSFAIRLGTVGPGEYQAPTVTTDGVQFTGITTPLPYLPSGVQQVFHFVAMKAGTYVVTFAHAGGIENQPTAVVDTVVVR